MVSVHFYNIYIQNEKNWLWTLNCSFKNKQNKLALHESMHFLLYNYKKFFHIHNHNAFNSFSNVVARNKWLYSSSSLKVRRGVALTVVLQKVLKLQGMNTRKYGLQLPWSGLRSIADCPVPFNLVDLGGELKNGNRFKSCELQQIKSWIQLLCLFLCCGLVLVQF